jgi:diguanylate cyclase (GGDEF)-like protein
MFEGVRFSNFELDKKIYEGSSSVIYKTKPQEGIPNTILKILKSDSFIEREIVRFHQEFSVSKKINSPYVTKVFNLIKDKNTIALAIEDIDAQSITVWLADHPPSLIEGLHIAITICKGMSDIHKAKIVHKDISSSHIIWNRKTNQVKINNFGIANILTKEITKPHIPSKLEGNLLYMSPEQTGRMNRPVDYRTDFYSFGVTLYEIFVGKLPFTSADPLELIYSHIAKTPIPPQNINLEIPPALSQIIIKLMQKEPENRYQTAYGIECDLIEILNQYQNSGSFSEFILASKDLNNSFIMPSKLYGRESDLAQLKHAFKKVCKGNMGLSLIKGYSGVGKTSLVHELYRPLAIARGRYTSGKFDQYNRSVPYSAFTTAFNGFCAQILEEPTEKITLWNERILSIVGKNGRVLTEIIPNLIKIIGPQPVLSTIDPQSAKNRFNEVFFNFVSVLCSPQEPMVLFLDDLQWADHASLDLLKLLLMQMRIKGLHLIGAYRDNEVESNHPLMLMLDEIKRAGQTYDILSLDNLTKNDITNLVSETLLLTKKQVNPMVSLIYNKTLGNAFYVTEFFKNLYLTGLLRYRNQKWEWDLNEINKQNTSDNVVDFMANLVKRLEPETQNAIMMAACIGNTFDLETLSITLHSVIDLPKMLHQIFPAIEAGIIIPKNDVYKNIGITDVNGAMVTFNFQHDRVQQASYSLIKIQDKPNIHQNIGKQLLHYSLKTKTSEERLFEIVSHLQKSISVVDNKEEQIQIAELNNRAGIKARAASAYKESSEYFLQAQKLLPKDCFKSHYELAFNIYLQLANSYYLNGQFEDSNALYPILIKCAKSKMDVVKVKIVQMDDYHLQGDYKKAIEIQKQALTLLDEPFPKKDKIESAIVGELVETPTFLANRTTENLLHANEISSPEVLAKLRVLVGMLMSAYLVSQDDIVQWCSIKMTNLTLKFGNSEFASFAYVQYGYICVLRLNKYTKGYEFGKLAIHLADQYPNLEMRGKVYFNFALFVNHWTQHISTSTDLFRTAYRLSLDSGDWTYAVYAAANIISNLLIEGKPCQDIEKEAQKYFDFLKAKAEVGFNSFFLPGGYVPLLNLIGRTKSDDSFDCMYLNEKKLLNTLGKLPIVKAWYYSAKIRSLFLFRCFDKATLLIDKADIVHDGVPAQIKIAESYFYSCLIITATFNQLRDKVAKQYNLDLFEKYKNALKYWAAQCPVNFLHKWLLIRAEESWLKNSNYNETLSLYDLAFEEAKKAGYLNNAALAQELKGRFWLQQNQAEYGLIHLRQAYKLYQEWGALAKVAQLAKEFPKINEIIIEKSATQKLIHSEVFTNTEIDYHCVYKLAQSLSQNLEWTKLISSGLTIIMENIGANRSILFLKKNSGWSIGAIGWIDANTGNVIVDCKKKESLKKTTHYPRTIINVVKNSLEIINIDSVNIPIEFSEDTFLQTKRDFSIICAPIKLGDQFTGIIYLENEFTSRAFSENRETMLKIVLSQFAISMENSRLFTSEQKSIRLYERALNIKRMNKQYALERKKIDLFLNQMAFFDQVTGLANHAQLTAVCDKMLKRAQRYKERIAVFFIDLDHFKLINDTYGHAVGDEVLKKVAGSLNASFRVSDISARIGGDEFVVVLNNISSSIEAKQLANKFLNSVNKTITITKHKILVQASIGISIFPDHGNNLETLLKKADFAMYQAKESGRNNVHMFHEK